MIFWDLRKIHKIPIGSYKQLRSKSWQVGFKKLHMFMKGEAVLKSASKQRCF